MDLLDLPLSILIGAPTPSAQKIVNTDFSDVEAAIAAIERSEFVSVIAVSTGVGLRSLPNCTRCPTFGPWPAISCRRDTSFRRALDPAEYSRGWAIPKPPTVRSGRQDARLGACFAKW